VVLSNDQDEDGEITALQIVVAPAHGDAIVQSDKTVLYTPAAGYTGNDNFVYRLLDNWNQPSNNALVAIVVKPPNQAPIAVDDSYNTPKNTVLNVPAASGLFINDSDDVDFELDIFDAVSAQGGAVTVNADGSFTYNPATDFVGIDTFTYRIKDTPGLTDTATVTIDVRDPDNPVANNDNYTTTRNQNLVVSAPGVLTNDTTGVGSLTATVETVATAEGGSVDIAANGQIIYSPPTDFVGNDTFPYTAENGSGTDEGIVTIQVLPNIYAKVQLIASPIEILQVECPGGTQHGGTRRRGIFKLQFYNNPGGTIPFDVSGLNLQVNVRITGTYYAAPGSYNNDFTVAVPGGTTFNLFGGSQYVYQLQQVDCDGEVVDYVNETISLQPGNYIII
jgi:hypothetical protein